LGDVIQLDSSVNDELKLKVEHLHKANGKLGVKNGKYAVKITKIIKEEDATDE
jgi:flagellar motor switch protein FliM